VSEADVDVSKGADASEGLNLQSLARDNAGLLIAGGIAAGALLAIALTPSSTRRRLAERAMDTASAAGEAGMNLGRQGAEKFGELSETVSENASVARERAAKAASDARGTGLELLRAALAVIAAMRR
jgi:hypothetical protein